MTGSTNLTALTPLIEMLVERSEAADRDRTLLDAPIYLGIAPAAALWRRVQAGGGPPVWREILARGPRQALPDRDQVEAVAEGELHGVLPEGRRILVAGRGLNLCALALGGVLGSEEETDLIEALLVAFSAIEEASGARTTSSGALDRVAPPLPAQSSTGVGEERERLCHDVRNHMASIRTTQELLKRYGERLTTDERTHFRSVLDREVRRASGLLVQAIHPGREQPVPISGLLGGSNPVGVVRDVADAERAACDAADIALEVMIEPGAEAAPCALDEIALARLVRNLIVNARQALQARPRREPARIWVRATLEEIDRGRWLRLSVEDNGPGIPEEDLPRVWDAGFTAHKEEGSGFGLTVVRDLVQRVGGRAEARNLFPSGASFVLHIPAERRSSTT